MTFLRRFRIAPFLFLALLVFSVSIHASDKAEPDIETPDIDFEHEDTFIDRSEALGSKQYVRRAILSSVIRETSRFSFDRWYVNHLMGFSAVFQKTVFAKYVTGCQGISVGFITEKGHGFEGGVELSGVSNIFGGYRHIFRPEKLSIWPFAGLGVGMEVAALRLADGPPEAQIYDGQTKMGFATLGLLIPLVDVGIKAETRFNFYSFDRLVLSSGVGVIVFL